MAEDVAEVVALREALTEIARLRLATSEGSLRNRADRMWEVASKAIGAWERRT